MGVAEQEILRVFPGLDQTVLKITSQETSRYNCIAYAAGDDARWWWPDPLGIGYWPKAAPRLIMILAFQKAFESIGYYLSPNSDLQPNFTKVAFFHKNSIPQHAALQLQNGVWSSKLGKSFDISHDLKGMEGKEYGQIALIMQRPK